MFDLPRIAGSRTLTGLILILGVLVLLTLGVGAIILTSSEGDGNQGISWGERILAALTTLGLGQFWRESKREETQIAEVQAEAQTQIAEAKEKGQE